MKKLIATLFVLLAIAQSAQAGSLTGVSSINNNTGAFTFTGAGVGCTGTTCTFNGGGTPGGSANQLQYNSAGSAFAGLSNANNNFKYLMGNGTSSPPVWSNPASLVDPRTYGASCVGPGYTGGLSSSNQGIFLSNTTTGLTQGAGLTNGTYTSVPITGGSGSGAVATITVSGNVVTSISITTAGSGYKLKDQISASVSNIGGTGTPFVAQVAHFNSNQTPVYDGVHDDTQAFNTAIAVAQNTGQGVLVPNGCWISSITIPQGIVMVGEGFSPSYGYNFNGGTADAMPVLYIESPGGVAPQYGIQFNADPNDGFAGFEINATAQAGAYGSTYCIGTGQNGGGGQAKIWLNYMAFKGCTAGIGTPNGSTVFLISTNNDYGANQYGIYGNMSDLYVNGDTFVSSTTGIVLDGGAGEVRVSNSRFEYNAVGMEIKNFGGVNLDNNQFDNNCKTGLLVSGSTNGQQIMITNGIFQNNGQKASGCTGTWVAGQEADITLSRTTSNGVYLHVSNVLFGGYGSQQPAYLIESTTAGANNDYVFITDGDGYNGYQTACFNWISGQPPHLQTKIPGCAYYDSTQNSLSINSGSAGGGGVGIGTTAPNAYAALDLSKNTNALIVPIGTTGQQPASPVVGMMRYNSLTNSFEGYSGASPSWSNIGGLNLASNYAFTGNNSYAGTTTYTGVTTYSGTSLIMPVRVVTTSGAITVSNTTDYEIIVNKTTGAATTVNLPSPYATGQVFVIKDGKGDAATNNITVTPQSGTIDGAATYVINTNYGVAAFIYNGTQWNQQ